MNSFLLGLGLFFLGLRLVSDNLRQLAGPGFRQVIKRTTRFPLSGPLFGIGAGALMQSATAVTFLTASLVSSGLLKTGPASAIVVWCNVGLTALAFVATLNIHPLIAYLIGGAGIMLGFLRIRVWQTLASALLGLGLILAGLDQMGEGAAPLKTTSWFQSLLNLAEATPPIAFLAGVAAAAILQSNTGATMLVITLAGAGALKVETGALLIYGTNLGAIGLRTILSSGLEGNSKRLVRLEDLFCVGSGLLMVLLFVIEKLGIPGVLALSAKIDAGISGQLAIIFLISNLLPALLITPFLPRVWQFLLKLMPVDPQEIAGKPRYLTSQALEDPATAMDLIPKENSRLLLLVRVPGPHSQYTESAPPEDFHQLSLKIENFCAKLASRNPLTETDAQRLHLLRAQLSVVRHVEESVRHFSLAADRIGPNTSERAGSQLGDVLGELLIQAAQALDSNDPKDSAKLSEQTSLHGDYMASLRTRIMAPDGSGKSDLNSVGIFEDFEIAVWTIHRLAKFLERFQNSAST